MKIGLDIFIFTILSINGQSQCENVYVKFRECSIRIDSVSNNTFYATMPLNCNGYKVDSLPDGNYIVKRENNIIESIFSLKKGKYQGTYLSYYKNGVLCFSGSYKDGLPIAIAFSFWENGLPEVISYYDKNGRFIKQEFYSKTGNQISLMEHMREKAKCD